MVGENALRLVVGGEMTVFGKVEGLALSVLIGGDVGRIPPGCFTVTNDITLALWHHLKKSDVVRLIQIFTASLCQSKQRTS